MRRLLCVIFCAAGPMLLCAPLAEAASCTKFTNGQTQSVTGTVGGVTTNPAGGTNINFTIEHPCSDDDLYVTIGGDAQKYPGCKAGDHIEAIGKIEIQDDEDEFLNAVKDVWLTPTAPFVCRPTNAKAP